MSCFSHCWGCWWRLPWHSGASGGAASTLGLITPFWRWCRTAGTAAGSCLCTVEKLSKSAGDGDGDDGVRSGPMNWRTGSFESSWSQLRFEMRTGAESRRTPELRHDEEEDPIWKCSEPKRTEDRYRSSLPKIATEARFCWPVKKLHKRVSRAGERVLSD